MGRRFAHVLALLAHAVFGMAWLATPVAAHVAVHVHRPVLPRTVLAGRGAPDGPIGAEVLEALRVAQQEVQVDPSLLLAIAYKESSFDPKAKNRLSSARGLLQFTEATWLEMVRDFGPRHGLSAYAAAIGTDRTGRITVRDRHLRAAILRLRDQPQLSAIMAAERLRWKGEALAAQLGRALSAADLYVLYLLDPVGAHRFLVEMGQHPDASSVSVVGTGARPNAGLFTRAGRALTVAEAYGGIRDMIADQQSRYASQLAAVATEAP